MKIRDGYIIRKLQDTWYLLPIGQNIASYHKSIALNDTSLFLCQHLINDISVTELLKLLALHYEAKEDEMPILKNDLTVFLNQLMNLDILISDVVLTPADCHFQFGTLGIAYHGPMELLFPSLHDFKCPKRDVIQHWIMVDNVPSMQLEGTILVTNEELTICKNGDDYSIYFHREEGIRQCHITNHLSHAFFYYSNTNIDILQEQLLNAFRLAFSIAAQHHGFYLMHSVSIEYQDSLWLFSGASGTGKSTHTNLWNKLFDTPIMDGDVNLLSMDNDTLRAWGIPWCGTSHIYFTGHKPLGGIVLLQQSPNNYVEELSSSAKELYTMQRLISPTWTADLMDRNLLFSHQLATHVPIYRLHCNIEDEAAYTIKNYIDALIYD